jgi:hypothetical protein
MVSGFENPNKIDASNPVLAGSGGNFLPGPFRRR